MPWWPRRVEVDGVTTAAQPAPNCLMPSGRHDHVMVSGALLIADESFHHFFQLESSSRTLAVEPVTSRTTLVGVSTVIVVPEECKGVEFGLGSSWRGIYPSDVPHV